jgi:hypothetical protein
MERKEYKKNRLGHTHWLRQVLGKFRKTMKSDGSNHEKKSMSLKLRMGLTAMRWVLVSGNP